MKVSGFTLVRNGVEFDYPFVESIRSVLPLCDEFIVNIGISTDTTKETLEKLKSSLPPAESKKLLFFESDWPLNDPEKRKGGRILADQTNLALQRCTGDWCVYLQADEVLHEQDLALLKTQMQGWMTQPKIEGIVLQYVHFYGSYDVIQTSRSSYRREVRVIRNRLGIVSTGDAQSFRHANGTKLTAALSKARVFHYGWVRPQEIMKLKTGFMDTLYHPDAKADAPATGSNYLYKNIVGLKPFRASHPAVMQQKVAQTPRFDFTRAPKVFHIKDTLKVLLGWFESATGVRLFEYKNYELIKVKE